MSISPQGHKTQASDYARTLIRKQTVWWKQVLDVQAPYRWNIRRLRPGFTLDIGCGLGRNLLHLNGYGVGIDHNTDAITFARTRGLTALTPDEFQVSDFNVPERFDSLLLAHVVEHLMQPEATALIQKYLSNLKVGGRVILITPQEAGYRSDLTHVQFMDFERLGNIHRELGLEVLMEYSFPLPRFAGRIFTYNEFISAGRRDR